ncbi:aldo/keto reductase [Microbulbifer rhizosphaerae]|uniref:D-threo-aldose 1-dehydrogenase n=1 Tax=Microbulbifer rhizosphaerae TaxID=1562603 RepID=A0A7W4ZAE9_9GAMM|nr:aldo/keto reductase [Microbulbifer rhizosphaerae]MBB3061210.1 D-threo-aldose 1-dehydrogenase [Microbulbifer rhizosphaerae]
MFGEKRRIGQTALEVTALGFGAATLGNLYHPMPDEAAKAAIEKAFAAELNHIDTAPYYGFGLSERRVGDALREVPANEYVLSTKVGRLLVPCGKAEDKYGFCSPMPFEPVYDYSYDGVMRSYEHSIQRLGLPKIDILYMHDIGRVTHGSDHERLFRIAMEGGYKAMAELRSQGLVSAIGLGVNEYEVCEQAMDHADFDCFLLAGRYTLLEQQVLERFLPRCVESNTSIVLGGPYNSGILATGVKREGAIFHYNYEPAPREIIERVARIEEMCHEFAVPLPAAALQFPLAHPVVVSVIPGLSSPRRVESAVSQMQTAIPAAFWAALQDVGLIHPEAPLPGRKG